MKTKILSTIILAILLFPGLLVVGQVPQKINYQGVARNSSGTIMSNRTIGLRFSIHETSAAGPEIFVETMTAITNNYGTFTAEIGGGVASIGSFATISWSTGAKYLQIKIDPNGGTSYTDMGTYQILSVAYAQYAKNVLNNDDADPNPSNELQTLSIVGDQLTISNGNTVTLPGGGSTTTPGGSNGNVQFNNSGALGGDNNLFWDNTNKALGIGISTLETRKLKIYGTDAVSARIAITNPTTGSTASDGFQIGTSTVSDLDLLLWNYEAGRIRFGTNQTLRMCISAEGRLMLGPSDATPGGLMEINGNTNTGLPHLLLTEDDTEYARLMFKNTAATTKNWTVAGNSQTTDANSRLNFWYYNGTSGTDWLSITGTGEVQHAKTGESHILPIAYGFVNSAGSIVTGTSNVSSTWNSAGNRYEITIAGETYYYNQYITVITPSGSSVVPYTNSSAGKLWVTLKNLSGTSVQENFQFVVYKP